MKRTNRIFLIAKAGYFRDSLIALLNSLPNVDLYNPDIRIAEDLFEITSTCSDSTNDLVIIDFDSLSGLKSAQIQNWLKDRIKAQFIGLVSNRAQLDLANNLEIKFVLERSATAGELFRVIRNINSEGISAINRYPSKQVRSSLPTVYPIHHKLVATL